MLVEEGLRWAHEEGIYASVTSSKGKEPSYFKCGFLLEDGHAGVGENNPLASWQGGRIFWMVAEAVTK